MQLLEQTAEKGVVEQRFELEADGEVGLAGLSVRPGATDLERAARSLTIPVLFVFQWDDELMTRESGTALFDAIGSKEKTMHINPGGHVQIPMFERDDYDAFFSRHLKP
jgi:hypothetical protein